LRVDHKKEQLEEIKEQFEENEEATIGGSSKDIEVMGWCSTGNV
jgi:hypothetical protein